MDMDAYAPSPTPSTSSSTSSSSRRRSRHPLATAATSITGRKTWKTLKQKNEIVWPPLAEAKLIEALEKYRPGSGGDPNRVLLRFPRRNRFISEYILQATGIFRTAKQVGSRLQQLRDTCGDDRILSLLIHQQPATVKSESESPLPSTSTQLFPETELFADSPASQTTASSLDMWSDISSGSNTFGSDTETPLEVPGFSPTPPPPRRTTNVLIQLCDDPHGLPHFPLASRNLTPDPASSRRRVTLTGSSALWTIEPTVRFRASSLRPHHLYSSFSVCKHNMLIHTETTYLDLQSNPDSGPPYIYKTAFMPNFWSQLCFASELTDCVVTQDIVEVILLPDGGRQNREMLSVVYEFEHVLGSSPMTDSHNLAFEQYEQANTYVDPFTTPSVDCIRPLALPAGVSWERRHQSPSIPAPEYTFPWV